MAYAQPPVVLTFLAPAERCNQRCPACYITEVVQEPVTRSQLQPADYARFVEEFVEAGGSDPRDQLPGLRSHPPEFLALRGGGVSGGASPPSPH